MEGWNEAEWIGERPSQDDASATEDGVAVVCDGLGAHAGSGALAQAVSQRVCRKLAAAVRSWTPEKPLPVAAREIVGNLQQWILHKSGPGGFHPQAATTLTAAALVKGRGVLVLNVGDSPAYLLTEDPQDRLFELGTRHHDPRQTNSLTSVVWAGV